MTFTMLDAAEHARDMEDLARSCSSDPEKIIDHMALFIAALLYCMHNNKHFDTIKEDESILLYSALGMTPPAKQ